MVRLSISGQLSRPAPGTGLSGGEARRLVTPEGFPPGRGATRSGSLQSLGDGPRCASDAFRPPASRRCVRARRRGVELRRAVRQACEGAGRALDPLPLSTARIVVVIVGAGPRGEASPRCRPAYDDRSSSAGSQTQRHHLYAQEASGIGIRRNASATVITRPPTRRQASHVSSSAGVTRPASRLARQCAQLRPPREARDLKGIAALLVQPPRLQLVQGREPRPVVVTRGLLDRSGACGVVCAQPGERVLDLCRVRRLGGQQGSGRLGRRVGLGGDLRQFRRIVAASADPWRRRARRSQLPGSSGSPSPSARSHWPVWIGATARPPSA